MHNAPVPWLLLPVKSFLEGKQRLAPVLSDAERIQLNKSFFSHMLRVARVYPGMERTAVVGDADDVIQAALSHGARVIRCARPGLNQALSAGQLFLKREHATSMLILPVDLPFVRVQDLVSISSLGKRHSVVIAPDKTGTGTNALFLDGNVPLKFQFGANSFCLHRAESIRCGRQPYLFNNERISWDIDEPADLSLLERYASSIDCSSSFHRYRGSA